MSIESFKGVRAGSSKTSVSHARLGGCPRSRMNRSANERPSCPPHMPRSRTCDRICPLPQTFFSFPQDYSSPEGVFTALSVSNSQQQNSPVNTELSMSSEKHLVLHFLNAIPRIKTLPDSSRVESRFQWLFARGFCFRERTLDIRTFFWLK